MTSHLQILAGAGLTLAGAVVAFLGVVAIRHDDPALGKAGLATGLAAGVTGGHLVDRAVRRLP